jgi:cell division septum initiation protein DivIVA
MKPKEVIQRLIDVEREGRQRVASAREEAERLADEARQETSSAVDEAREEAEAEAKQMIEQAEAAQQEREGERQVSPPPGAMDPDDLRECGSANLQEAVSLLCTWVKGDSQ